MQIQDAVVLYTIDDDVYFEGDKLGKDHIIVALVEPQHRTFSVEKDDLFSGMWILIWLLGTKGQPLLINAR